MKRLEGKPNAYGIADMLTVVADEELWNDRVKDTIDYYYGSAYVILPQPEPIFDIKHVTPIQIKNYEIQRKHRCYLIVANLENENASFSVVCYYFVVAYYDIIYIMSYYYYRLLFYIIIIF